MTLQSLCEDNSEELKKWITTKEISEVEESFLNFVLLSKKLSRNKNFVDTINVFLGNPDLNYIDMSKDEVLITGLSFEETTKHHLKQYYQPRTEFDRHFENSTSFNYAALNVGGLGIQNPDFGSICWILKGFDEKKLCFVKKDSLSDAHFDKNGSLLIDVFKQELANWETVHLLAFQKLESQISHQKDWQKIVCSKDCYIECILTEQLTIENIEKVRISKEAIEKWQKSVLDMRLNRLSETEIMISNLWKCLKIALERRDLLETI